MKAGGLFAFGFGVSPTRGKRIRPQLSDVVKVALRNSNKVAILDTVMLLRCSDIEGHYSTLEIVEYTSELVLEALNQRQWSKSVINFFLIIT